MDAGMLLLGRYRLDRPIGAGGMGRVWAAFDTRLGRDVAIKVQQFDPAGDRVAFERFQREARSTAGLQHPNLVTIFDSATDADRAFLVMELLPGPTLEAYVAERGPLPEPEAVALAIAVASGLSAAHHAGVIHRDIKPTNLMFDGRGELKIVDFGIARLAQTAAARLTATKTVIGSAPYLSPEQLTGHPADERSDLYALGCVMTMMLTGRPPFEGEHPLALVHQHVNAAPPQLSERRASIDPALEALVAQLLSKSPQGRPQSALAVLDRLRDVELVSPVERSAVSLATTAVMGQATQPLPIPTTVTAVALPDRPQSHRGRWIAGGAVALALVAALIIAIASMTGEQPATDSAQSAEGPTSSASRTRSAEPSRAPAPSSSETMATAETTAATVQGALSDLRTAVAAVSSSGQIDDKKADELSKRVDELAKHVTEKDGKDAGKHVDDVEKYLRELSKKGELTAGGERRLAAALRTVRERAVEG